MSDNTSGGSRTSAGAASQSPGNNGIINRGSGHVNVGENTVIGGGRGGGNNGVVNRPRAGGTSAPARRSGRWGRARTEYQTVNVGSRQVRVAKTLSERTNARRGYCQTCSGNGCADCAGRGRATGGST